MSLTLIAKIFIVFALIVAWFRIKRRGGSIKKQWLPIVIGVFLGWNILAPLAILSVTYHGKVVDQETGNPIAGAVVTVVWFASPIIYIDQTRSFLNANETVTQNDGSFSLWTWPGISFNPFTYVLTPPDAIIYKAGYAPLSVPTTYDRGFQSYEALADALKKGIVMKLPKQSTREEVLSVTGPPVSGVVPFYSIPELVREVNVHRKKIGLID